MITFTCWFKHPEARRWRKVTKVKGDSLEAFHVEGQPRCFKRVLVRENEERIEIPLDYLFWTSRERYLLILERGKIEAGQDLNIDKK